MAGTPRFVIAAVVAGFNQAACAQHGDFAPKVQMILDYLKDSKETCISPNIPGAGSFKACREDTEPVALIIVTDIPVRDDDGRYHKPRCSRHCAASRSSRVECVPRTRITKRGATERHTFHITGFVTCPPSKMRDLTLVQFALPANALSMLAAPPAAAFLASPFSPSRHRGRCQDRLPPAVLASWSAASRATPRHGSRQLRH